MANAPAYNLLEKKTLLKGASPEQKKAINYFMPPTGCSALFGSVKDADYEAIVDGMVKASNSYQRAIDKIGLDESELQEIPPVTLFGYEESKFSKATESGAFRSNLYSITHLFFSSTQVYMYQLTFNTMKNDKKERTEEYFYKDITNFSTSTDNVEVTRLKGCGKFEKISIEIQKFALIVPGDKFYCATYGDIEASVKAMKNKLREKKM